MSLRTGMLWGGETSKAKDYYSKKYGRVPNFIELRKSQAELVLTKEELKNKKYCGMNVFINKYIGVGTMLIGFE